MTDAQESKTSLKPKGLRKYLQFGVSRWDVTISGIVSLFFFVVFMRALEGVERYDWITWVDALQTSLLFYIVAIASNLHYKLLGSKNDE